MTAATGHQQQYLQAPSQAAAAAAAAAAAQLVSPAAMLAAANAGHVYQPEQFYQMSAVNGALTTHSPYQNGLTAADYPAVAAAQLLQSQQAQSYAAGFAASPHLTAMAAHYQAPATSVADSRLQ
ncbi:unnamed protein product [Notodromas monacha]|uniref:Uncharacterized protein n=1 Tax=Notodromas monacha TaxID=399045 RepID=A0A7R9G8W1_9CRUS|nr:unnamed protein product [Notodromas monacha]CAG0912513.1 unnamed protein product [Notodromas monacha]